MTPLGLSEPPETMKDPRRIDGIPDERPFSHPEVFAERRQDLSHLEGTRPVH